MYNLNLLADKDLSQDWEGAEYSRESGAPIDHPMRQMVDLNAIRKVSHACARRRVVRMSDYDDTVATVNQFLTRSAVYDSIPATMAKWHADEHVRMTADIYDFQRLQVVDRRNQISYYTRQRLLSMECGHLHSNIRNVVRHFGGVDRASEALIRWQSSACFM